MEFKAVVTGPEYNSFVDDLLKKFSSLELAEKVLQEISGDTLGFERVLERPAEAYFQLPSRGVSDNIGVIMNLTGVSRNGREPKQLHEAKTKLHAIVKEVVEQVSLIFDFQLSVQVFVTITLDGEAPIAPGSGIYSSVLESEAEMVTSTSE